MIKAFSLLIKGAILVFLKNIITSFLFASITHFVYLNFLEDLCKLHITFIEWTSIIYLLTMVFSLNVLTKKYEDD